ncbi:MAG: hypothetical protein WBM00_02895 [Solirubrobacterales bacterium]
MRLLVDAFRPRPFAAALAVTLACVALSGGAFATAGQESTEQLVGSTMVIAGPKGVGELRLGMTVTALHERHLIGHVGRGCELAQGERAASLRPPLRGMAIFFRPNNRLWSVAVTKGTETSRNIGIGATASDVLRAYPGAEYNPPNPNAPLPQGVIGVNRLSHPKMTFVIDPHSHRVIELDVPYANFCE